MDVREVDGRLSPRTPKHPRTLRSSSFYIQRENLETAAEAPPAARRQAWSAPTPTGVRRRPHAAPLQTASSPVSSSTAQRELTFPSPTSELFERRYFRADGHSGKAKIVTRCELGAPPQYEPGTPQHGAPQLGANRRCILEPDVATLEATRLKAKIAMLTEQLNAAKASAVEAAKEAQERVQEQLQAAKAAAVAEVKKEMQGEVAEQGACPSPSRARESAAEQNSLFVVAQGSSPPEARLVKQRGEARRKEENEIDRACRTARKKMDSELESAKAMRAWTAQGWVESLDTGALLGGAVIQDIEDMVCHKRAMHAYSDRARAKKSTCFASQSISPEHLPEHLPRARALPLWLCSLH